jgi:hypothetical protein
MVPYLCSVVEHATFGIPNEILEIEIRDVGTRDRFLQFVHIALMMLGVMQIKRFGADVWFESCVVIR